jgi:hypothetical protein
VKEKTPGKTPQADELVTTKEIDKTPGKATRSDDGAAPAPSQNLLSEAERNERLLNLKIRIVAAGARCNDAIQAVKFETLLKKPDDVPWWFGMLLDVCVTSLTTSAIKALTKYKAGKIGELGKAAGDAAFHGDTAALEFADKRKAMFAAISDESIKARVGMIGGFAKSEAKSIVAMTLADSADKAQTLSYLHQLQKSMDIAFQNLGEQGTKDLSDPELLVMYDAMDASHHDSESYERAITDKIDRYKKSGIDAIGKRHEPLAIADPKRHYEAIGDVDSERRVVWAEYPDKSKALWFYERAESTTNARARELAAGLGMDGRFRLTGIVPHEFQSEAIAREQEVTGREVETLRDSPETRALLHLPDHKARMDAARLPGKGTIRSATNKIFGGK